MHQNKYDEEILKTINVINELKDKQVDYFYKLLHIENNIGNASLFVSIQACTVLAEDFYLYSSADQASKYVNNGIDVFNKMVKSHLIEKNNFYFLTECLNRLLVVKIKLFGDFNILYEYQSFLQSNSKEVFHFLADKWFASANTKISMTTNTTSEHDHNEAAVKERFVTAIDFVCNNEQINILITYFGLYYDQKSHNTYLLKFEHLKKKFRQVILLQVSLDMKYIEEFIEYIINQKQHMSELSMVFMICLKIGTLDTFKMIIMEILKLTNILTEDEVKNLRAVTTSLVKNLDNNRIGCKSLQELCQKKSKSRIGHLNFFLDINMRDIIDWHDLIMYFFVCKNFELILELSQHNIAVPNKFLFCCYLETGEMLLAESLYDEELRRRFQAANSSSTFDISLDDEPDKCMITAQTDDRIEQKDIFKFFVMAEKISSALNILDKIDSVTDYIECMKLLVLKRSVLLKDALYTGIKKFFQNFIFIKIALSIIHLNDVDITANERAILILELFFGSKNSHLYGFWPDKEFIINILYNNILDVNDVNIKYQLLKGMKLILPVHEDTLFMLLHVFREIEQNMYDTTPKLDDPMDEVLGFFKTNIEEILLHLGENMSVLNHETVILLYDYYKGIDKNKSDAIFNHIPIEKLSKSNLFILCDLIDDLKIVKVVKTMDTKKILTIEILNEIYVRFSVYGIHNLIALCDAIETISLDCRSKILMTMLKSRLKYIETLKNPFIKRRILYFLRNSP